MMLTIQGLPSSTSYQELKRLIKQECNITDFILDSLVMDDDGCKKVRIGVTDDGDGSHLMKCLNGYHYSGHVIRVAPVGKPPQSQPNQGNFDTRGGYQTRNDYSTNNFGNRAIPHDNQQPRANNWVPNVPWGQNMAFQPAQHTFPNQPIPPVVANNFTSQQQPRAFVPGVAPQHGQGFGYPVKSNVSEQPGSGQFHHQSVSQGHFPGQSHVQSTPWASQVQPAKPQAFDKASTGSYNQMGFNDNRQGPKQGSGHDSGYKDYDKSDRRFAPPRVSSPGRRSSRMSPEPSGRQISPTGLQGRRMSPPRGQGRRMSPPGHQSRRNSPPASGPPGRRTSPSSHGRRMSPSRTGGPVSGVRGISPSSGRRISPSRQGMSPHGRKLSPGAQGRRISPGSYRRSSPSGTQGRRISPPGPHGQRDGVPVRRMSPSSRRESPPRREPSPGRRSSPNRRRASPGRQSPVRRGSPSRRLSPKRHSPGRHSVSPHRQSPLLDNPAGMRGCNETKEETVEENPDFSKDLLEDDLMDFDANSEEDNENNDNEESLSLNNKLENAVNDDPVQYTTGEKNWDAFTHPEVRKVLSCLSGAGRKRYKILIADNVPWRKALEMCQKRWSQLPPGANPKKRARLQKQAKLAAGDHSQTNDNNYFFKGKGKYNEVSIKNVTPMTQKQTEILRQSLISEILKTPKSEAPRFDNYGYQCGNLLISCKDKQSQMWLQKIIPTLVPWPGAKLTATLIRVLPKPMILHVFIPETEVTDPGQAFTLFRVQNRGLNTKDWVMKSSIAVKGGMFMSVLVDQRSAEILKESNFKACLGLKTIRFNRADYGTIKKPVRI